MPKPPKFAERLLRWLVPGRDGEILAGDLHEELESHRRGSLWYWRQVASCVAVIPAARQDLHYAFRMLRRNPGYTATAILCLALGIGVNTSVFSVINELFWRRLPVPDAGRVVTLDRPSGHSVSYPDFQDLRGQADQFDGVLVFDGFPTSLDTGDRSALIQAESVSTNYAQVLRLGTSAGRWFDDADERSAGAQFLGVISDRVWAER